ncbi:hypothetical protein JAAARDRAFT_193818 [Jaapia argillacea MUCL 33604]|uniref:Uncharacterized protein n=1 Tax=Jaapia argillacea MUCL 33604 TaxID=933084 RepID=A0A067PRZ4_9AGAM|nr:hypothetical protein JAAARDRAFT_193818 [Jaapia argillacea MUCL 33604]
MFFAKFFATVADVVRAAWSSFVSHSLFRAADKDTCLPVSVSVSTTGSSTSPVKTTPVKPILVNVTTSQTVERDLEAGLPYLSPPSNIWTPTPHKPKKTPPKSSPGAHEQRSHEHILGRVANLAAEPPSSILLSAASSEYVHSLNIPDDASIRHSFAQMNEFVPRSPPSPTPSSSSSSSNSSSPPATPPTPSFEITSPTIHSDEDQDITDHYYQTRSHFSIPVYASYSTIGEEEGIQNSILVASAMVSNSIRSTTRNNIMNASKTPAAFRHYPVKIPTVSEKIRIQRQLAKTSQSSSLRTLLVPKPKLKPKSGPSFLAPPHNTFKNPNPFQGSQMTEEEKRTSSLKPLLLPIVVDRVKRESVGSGKEVKESCESLVGLGLALGGLEDGVRICIEGEGEEEWDEEEGIGGWDEEEFIGAYAL